MPERPPTVNRVTYGDLKISRADIVLTHGVAPSYSILDCVAEGSVVNVGPLRVYSDGVLCATLHDCAVDYSHVTQPMVRHGHRCKIRVADRRWRWSQKRVSGRYNVRQSNSTALAGTQRSYRELIEILLQALGESSYVIELLHPDLQGPSVVWQNARADLELARLVDEVGGIIYLGLDNLVHIVRNGTGPAYPPIGRERLPLIEFTPTALPKFVQVKTAPICYQSKLRLEAVGVDRSGEVVPINRLSYRPAGGWGEQVPGVYNDVKDELDRELARQTVYKWYRVKSQANGSLTLPGGVEQVSSVECMLPLLPYLVLPQIPANWSELSPPAMPFVEGEFFNNDWTGLPEKGEGGYAKWDNGFELDLDRGIVKFDQYVYLPITDGEQQEAELYLECAYHARRDRISADYFCLVDVATGVEQDLAAGVVQIERPDIWLYRVQRYFYGSKVPSGVEDNEQWVSSGCVQQGQSYAQHYTNVPRGNMQWTGVLPYGVRGNMHQVRWRIGDGPAMTYGSVNTENPALGPVVFERRLREEGERVIRNLRR